MKIKGTIRRTFGRLSSLAFIFHLTSLFSCHWQPNTSQSLCMWWSHWVIYKLAVWGKAVSMLSGPRGIYPGLRDAVCFEWYCSFMSARACSLTHKELSVTFRCYKTYFSLRCQDSQGLESNLLLWKEMVVAVKGLRHSCWLWWVNAELSRLF